VVNELQAVRCGFLGRDPVAEDEKPVDMGVADPTHLPHGLHTEAAAWASSSTAAVTMLTSSTSSVFRNDPLTMAPPETIRVRIPNRSRSFDTARGRSSWFSPAKIHEIPRSRR
jgi:hypothetical protein